MQPYTSRTPDETPKQFERFREIYNLQSVEDILES